MYAKRSRSTRKPRRSHRRYKRSNRRIHRRVRKMVAPNETACIKQTVQYTDIQANAPYCPVFFLSQCSRAEDLADNFQEYRISRVELKYTPLYDTFASSIMPGTSNVNMTVPYLYTKQQVTQTPAVFTLDYLKVQGARPIRLDDKTITHKYRPHILQSATIESGGSGTNPSARALKSPWLSTHVNNGTTLDDTNHFTNAFWVDQDVENSITNKVCSLEATIYFEFRKPWDVETVPVDARPTVFLGASSKGV